MAIQNNQPRPWGEAFAGAFRFTMARAILGWGAVIVVAVFGALLIGIRENQEWVGILAAVSIGSLAGGFLAELQAIRRSSRLVHQLAEEAATRTGEAPVPELWLHRKVLSRRYSSVKGKVIDIRHAPSGELLVGIKEADGQIYQALCSKKYEQSYGPVKVGDDFSLTCTVYGIMGSRLCVRDPSLDGGD